MFGHKKKESPASAQAGLAVAPETLDRIHTMPERFYFAPRARANRAFVGFGGLTIVVGVLVAVALAVWKFGPAPAGGPAGTPAASPAPAAPAFTPVPAASPSPAAPAPAPTPQASPAPAPEPSPTPTPSGPLGTGDADGDGLTLDEERLYGTSPANADSDGDGYPDGAEVRRGFSPRRAAGATLADDGLFTSAKTSSGLSWSYPASWLSEEFDAAGVATVRLDTRLGEEITAARFVPAGRLPLEAWLTQQGVIEVDDVEVGGRRAKRQQNPPGYYFASADGAAVWAVRYHWLGEGRSSFAATFAAVADSVRFP